MANIMSLKSLRNKTSRNGFDLSFKKNFTAKAGELLPVMVKEVLPGDSFKINLKSFTRTQPLNTAAFARMREYYDFYFVPYDLLWNRSNTVLTQMADNPQHAVSLTGAPVSMQSQMPNVTMSDIADYLASLENLEVDKSLNYFGYSRAKCSAKLLEYLGYGDYYEYADGPTAWNSAPKMVDLSVNLFGLLAYQKIYADYYRDSQWERVSPSCFNVDYISGYEDQFVDISTAGFSDSYNMFDLRYCNWQKDLFHGVVPRSQFGSPAVVTSDKTTDTSSEFSILALRQAEFLQKWKEITMSANQDYKDQIEKHWNVSVGDGFSELCTYLGGVTSSLDINEVVNNNITGDNGADIAGKGTGVGDGSISFNSNGRYGLIMCIYHCLPLLDYTSSIMNSAFTKVNSLDYAIPEFDRVGMESVPLVSFFNPVKSSLPPEFKSDTIIGYAPRYIDYKTSIDNSVGDFRSSMRNWVISYDEKSVLSQLTTVVANGDPSSPVGSDINFTFFKVNPNCVDPLFAVNVDDTISTDNFLCSSFFDIKVVRNLDTDGLPY